MKMPGLFGMGNVACHRNMFLVAWLGIGLLTPVFGQIGISMKMDRTKYLSYEPIKAQVTLRNDTGNTLVFDDKSKESMLTIRVVNSDGVWIQPHGEINPVAGLILGAGETRTLNFQLNSVFGMDRADIYTISAQVGHSRLSSAYAIREPLKISVVGGAEIWSQEFGLPAEGSQAAIATRKVTLLIFSDGKREMYALRLEDDDSIYGVIRLGPRFSGNRPKCEVDVFSNIHVLHLIKPRLVEYRVLDSDFRQKLHRIYAVDNNPPRLQRDPELGQIMVVGGRRAVEGTDYAIDDVGRDETEKVPAIRPPEVDTKRPVVMPPDTDLQRSGAPISQTGAVTPSSAKPGVTAGPAPEKSKAQSWWKFWK